MNNAVTADAPDGILDVLRTVNRGSTLFDLEEEMEKIVHEVTELQGGKGVLTLKLEIGFDPQTSAIKVVPKLSTKLPDKPVRGTLYFPTPQNRLSKADPRQRDMFPE